MPRKPRSVMVGHSHYILQTGHNHQPVFKSDIDYREYLMEVMTLKERFQVEVQAWCLFPQNAHLLLRPTSNERSLAEFMKSLAASHTRHFNVRYQHSGTLWEGRYRCSLVEPGHWQLACLRYLEYLPVLRSLVTRPRYYSWSSYAMRMGGTQHDWLDHADDYLALSSDSSERRSLYREFVAQGCDPREQSKIEAAVWRGQLIGSDRFIDEVEAATGQRILFRGPGRPRKTRPGGG